MNNKKKKLLLLFPALLLLTGCEYTYYDTWKHLFGGLKSMIENFAVGVLEAVNMVLAGLIEMTKLSIGNINDTARTFISLFTNFSKVVNAVYLLAAVFIVINTAKLIYKTHFATNDGRYAPSPATIVKKVIIGLVVAYLIPYICVTGFVATTYAGQAVSNLIYSDKNTEEDPYNIYVYMLQDHVSFTTYCATNQPDGHDSFSGVAGNNGPNGLSVENRAIVINDEKWSGEIYNRYCADGINYATGETVKPRNVYEGLKFSKTYSSAILLGGQFNASEDSFVKNILSGATKVVISALSGLIAPIYSLLVILVMVVILIAVARRVIDLIFLVGMSWWYIASSVGDEQNENSLSDLWKKLLSICLTQFITTFELCMFVVLCLEQPITITNTIMAGAWVTVMMSTPTIVEEMVTSTGTAESAASKAKALGRFFSGGN